MKVTQSCLTVCDSMDYTVHGILQTRILEWVAIPLLLQEIFPTQGLNPGLPHCRWILYQLSYQGSPRIILFINQLQSPCFTLDLSVALGFLVCSFVFLAALGLRCCAQAYSNCKVDYN